ncbi:MAG: NADH-quinone oxidoreductase subunit C [Magnetococcales bacterium]|nr:NADH-quinone oxidoreductase subunit C [Magnetococcales bacterium]
MIAAKLDALETALRREFPEVALERLADALVMRLDPADLVATATRLRDDEAFDFKILIDIAGVHYPDREPEFEVVYQLLSVYRNHRLRLKVGAADGEAVPSVIEVWSSANWGEREVYDLFGIPFANHPDLRRILNEYDFEGYPLRKDFPVTGHYEVRYDPEVGRVVREPTDLALGNRELYAPVGRPPSPGSGGRG